MKRLVSFGIAFVFVLGIAVHFGCGTSEPPVSPTADGQALDLAAKLPKVLVCHIPPGNPENAHVIEISENALPAHLAHGDCLAPAGAKAGDDCECAGGPDPACAGATCETYIPCDDPDSTCAAPVCATTAEGGGVCVEGLTPCEGLPRCTGSGDCPEGWICVVATCCGEPVCIPPEAFCNPEGNTTTATSKPARGILESSRPSGPTLAGY